VFAVIGIAAIALVAGATASWRVRSVWVWLPQNHALRIDSAKKRVRTCVLSG